MIDAGLGGGTLRQAPMVPNPRWTASRTVGKVTGRELAGPEPGAHRRRSCAPGGASPASAAWWPWTR